MPKLTMTPFLSSALIALVPATASAAEKLTIYTYESFTAEWGPGPAVRDSFEAECACEVDFVAVADGVALLTRLKLEGDNTKADIVLGLDTNLTAEATDSGFFAPHGLTPDNLTVPGNWSDQTFLPYDYGWFAVVYDSEAISNPPTSLKDLVEGDASQKLVIQDPRTSTPGLGFLLWMKSVYGDDAPAAWQKLSSRILTVTPGWSEAYSLFTDGEAPMVLSYTTSPAYHEIVEETDRYKAASFSEGHYMQVEVAGMTKHGAANPLAKQFLEFMTSTGFQDQIPEKNWMMPAAQTSQPLNPVFDTLVKPNNDLLFSPQDVRDNRHAFIAEWLEAMSK